MAALVLAAGRSRRFGRADKRFAAVAGRPLIEWTLRAVLASRATPVRVVIGRESPRLRTLLRRLRGVAGPRLRLLRNRQWRQGMGSSLAAAVAALPPDCAGALVCLADMPGVRAQVMDRLIAALQPGDVAVQASYRGQRGHPVLLARCLFPQLKTLGGDQGARAVIARHPSLRLLDCAEAAPLDVDTRADWRRLARCSRAAAGPRPRLIGLTFINRE